MCGSGQLEAAVGVGNSLGQDGWKELGRVDGRREKIKWLEMRIRDYNKAKLVNL